MGNDLLKQVSALRRAQGRESLQAFARLYLSRYVRKKPSSAHDEIHQLLLEFTRKRDGKLAVAAPRGFGKSTLVTLLYVLYSICYQQEKFIVILSATSSQAKQFLDDIRRELEENERLLADFPELAGSKPAPWSRAEILTPTGIRVLTLGSGQLIRGRKHGTDRPTLIIADDLENAEKAFSLESREHLRSWFTSSILKAGSEKTNFLFLGTLHHPHCLLAEYVDPKAHPEWKKTVHKAVCSRAVREDLWGKWSQIYNGRELWEEGFGPETAKKFYESHRTEMDKGAQVLWPERWSYYDLMTQYEDDPISFNSELQNEPHNPKDAIFNLEELSYWDDHYGSVEAILRALGDDVEFYGACDPSMGLDTMRGDYTAIIVLAKDTKENRFYVVLTDIRRCTPTQTIDAIFAYHRRFSFRKFSIEANQFQELMVQEVERRSGEEGIYPPIEPIKNTGDKVRRIQTLHPSLKGGAVRLHHSQILLLEQLRYFPVGKHDDGPDALQMAVQLAQQPSCRITALTVGHDVSPVRGYDGYSWEDGVRWHDLG